LAIPITPVGLGDTVRLKKPHPCGANEWEVVRLGADIRLHCCSCGRSVMLERYEFDRRFRGFIQRAEDRERAGAGGTGAGSAGAEDAGAAGDAGAKNARDRF